MLQFGTFVPQGWRLDLGHVTGAAEQWARAKGVACKLEEIGFDSLWLSERISGPAPDPTEGPRRSAPRARTRRP